MLVYMYHQMCHHLCVFVLSSDIQEIILDPVQAVNDAVDEVSSLLNKFHGALREMVCTVHFVCVLNNDHFRTPYSLLGPRVRT